MTPPCLRACDDGAPAGWAPSTFATSGKIGITAVSTLTADSDSDGRPDGALQGVAAADYSLDAISAQLLASLVGIDTNITWAYIVERAGPHAGALIGSTTDAVLDERGQRRQAVSSIHPAVAFSAWV
eukprot:COSAG01_NODE_14974_length_1389_cov_5.037634_1_plen_126_part_10